MENEDKKMDELFDAARKAEVKVPLDKVAKTLVTGAALGSAAAAGAASASATASATAGATTTFLSLTTPTIMTGTLITAAATATVIAVSNNNDPVEEPQTPAPIEQVVEPTETLAEDTKEAPLTYQALEQTISDELEMEIELDDFDLPEDIAVEETMVDKSYLLSDGSTVHIEKTSAPLKVTKAPKPGTISCTIRWNDSEEDFRKSIDFLIGEGLKVNVNRNETENGVNRLRLNMIDSTATHLDVLNINLRGEYEIEIGWQVLGEKRELYYETESQGMVNIVHNDYETGAKSKKKTNIRVTSTSTDGNGNTGTSAVTTDGTGSTSTVSTDNNTTTSTVTTTTITVDKDGNTIKNKKKEVKKEKEKQKEKEKLKTPETPEKPDND